MASAGRSSLRRSCMFLSRGMSTAGWRHASPRPQLHCREGPVPDAAVCSQLRLGRPPDHTEPVGSCQCPADCPVPLAASHQPRNCFAEFRTLSTKPPISNFPLLKSASNLSLKISKTKLSDEMQPHQLGIRSRRCQCVAKRRSRA